MNFKGANARHSIVFSALLFLLTACGGGSSDEDSTGPKEFTYQPLTTSMKIDEGETVTLTLNLTGKGADKVKFDWSVGRNIKFSGQGTDTITFVAPEVEHSTSFNVQVELDRSNGNVFGFIAQSTFVTIKNVEKLTDNSSSDLNFTLPVVTTLDYDLLTAGSTWLQHTGLETYVERADGSTLIANINKDNLLHINSVNVSSQTLSVAECGLPQAVDFMVAEFEQDFDCENEQSSLVFRQSDDAFQLVRMCGNNVAVNTTFTKLSDERVESNGELNIDFSTYANLEQTTDVCGSSTTTSVRLYDTNDSLLEIAHASVIRLFTQYEGSPLELYFQLDTQPTGSFAFLDSKFSADNVAKVFSDVLPEISNRSQSHSGKIQFDFNNDFKNIDADFDFSIYSTTNHEEFLEGKFKLSFE
ncbi:hypothetical protein [Psychrobium sp. 1_MG-2023]|uniref:hypothetical protein n=1 Tax=Psychrobium sp. 1_MG-2023 TaxID=3062624 RepID=UPI000C325055|nr:hypothetical protein [Psychrobium sp. 1_MG-2023]MDP2562795.1 hypothetical protein [Psychrobium sp. 1_MG-2023]PKF54456.1 hypothetical protein CW748_15920 [Alteromonadales bacterium alter-6D02]